MMSGNATICVDVAVVDQMMTRRRSAKPEWHNSQAKFIINLCNIEKQRQQLAASNVIFSSSHFVYEEKKGFGSRNDTSSPDSYVWRQRFLRSYTFTREEDYLEKKKKMVVGLFTRVLKNMERWINKAKGIEFKGDGCFFVVFGVATM
ncbi:hypothetical protein LINGRAHAP2_LOCUS8946 [Linum grandiflorum]